MDRLEADELFVEALYVEELDVDELGIDELDANGLNGNGLDINRLESGVLLPPGLMELLRNLTGVRLLQCSGENGLESSPAIVLRRPGIVSFKADLYFAKVNGWYLPPSRRVFLGS